MHVNILYVYTVLKINPITFNSALCEDRDIRLSSDSYGRVEVCSNGLWRTICSDEFWDDHNARVICNQLGFSQYGKTLLLYLEHLSPPVTSKGLCL